MSSRDTSQEFTWSVKHETRALTFWRPNYFILILAPPVYKMWIIQEQIKLELWKQVHFEERDKPENIYHIYNIQYLYLLNKYTKCNV